MQSGLIPFTGIPRRDDQMLTDLKEFPFKVGDKEVFIPTSMITNDELKAVDNFFNVSGDANAPVTLSLPYSFAAANDLPLPASETGVHTEGTAGASPGTPSKPRRQRASSKGTSGVAGGSPSPDTGTAGNSDARTVNNVMRHEYRVLNDLEKAHMKELKDLGLNLVGKLQDIARDTGGQESRELSIAHAKVEEAVMWGVKHITR